MKINIQTDIRIETIDIQNENKNIKKYMQLTSSFIMISNRSNRTKKSIQIKNSTMKNHQICICIIYNQNHQMYVKNAKQ